VRTFAIGDIHGCQHALQVLLSQLAPTAGDRLVFLGDYVDRGPDSAGVIDTLIALCRTPELEVVCLQGNHEEMMLQARKDRAVRAAWASFGGTQTLRSYGQDGFPHCVPAEHWRFLEATGDYHETDTHVLTHAPISSGLPVAVQGPSAWRWSFETPTRPHCSGKHVVCGHRSQRDGLPRLVAGTFFIDTWAYAGQWLTALQLETGEAVQANQLGEVRCLPCVVGQAG